MDENKVVPLRQSKTTGVSTDEAITPKSLLDMTEAEQEAHLNLLRERRLQAAKVIQQALMAQKYANSMRALSKLQAKVAQVQKQYDRASKAIDKLEELIHGMRALYLQHTDKDVREGESGI